MTFSVRQLPKFSVMGILNVTPDSFSDAGRCASVDSALRHGVKLAHDGAAIVDIGGESSRPGAVPVSKSVELDRVVPVIERLIGEIGVPISVDTTKAAVADAALEAGASIVNDISGGRHDAQMLNTVVRHDAGLIAMHMQGIPATMQASPQYRDVVPEVIAFLQDRVAAARSAGVRRDAIIADPGIGFGKNFDHNLELLAHLERMVAAIDAPILIGASRKGFIGSILGGAPVEARDDATAAVSVLAFLRGVAIVRVHNVGASVASARLLDAVSTAAQQGVLT